MSGLVLPQPTKNARDVYEITGAILEAIPGVNVLKKYADIQLARSIESALEKLASEVKENGIEVLNDTQIQFYLPSAYRFAEQVRVGDYEHNLKILRKILIGGLKSNSIDTGKIGRHARQLEYLTEFELSMLVASQQLEAHFQKKNGDRGFVMSAGIRENIPAFADVETTQIILALAVLSTRGLLYSTGVSVWDQSEDAYSVAPDGLAVINAALEK